MPPDRWIWSSLPGVQDEVDFLWANPNDRSARLGKFVTRYPPFWQLAYRALRQASRRQYDLIVAWESKAGVPLALLRRVTRRRRTPFAILTFTPGEVAPAFYSFVRFALGAVDRVSVLTNGEIPVYRSLFGLPGSRISLCLLGTYDLLAQAGSSEGLALYPAPYVHASGRSARDYATLVRAAEGLSARVVIHGRGYNFSRLAVPANVTIGDLVPRDQYHRLLLGAAVEVVPLVDTPAPVGSSQIVFSMMMGKAIVATRTGATVDYIEDGVSGLLVAPGDAAGMAAAIERLLRNPAEAAAMGRAARRRYEECYTFDAFARRVRDVMAATVAQRESSL